MSSAAETKSRPQPEDFLKNLSVADALISFAREYGITHVVMGRSAKRPLWDRLRSSVIDVLTHELKDVDLVIV
jgi:two-component system sensor histidine kinase KdpD